MRSKHRKELIDEIKMQAQSHGINTIFTTFLEITANSIAAQMDPVNSERCEARYCEIVKDMSPETVSSYARMFALLALVIREHEDDPCDVLGGIYHELNLNNEWSGQFFTPDHVCRMMAQITISPELFENRSEPVMINEPACGSGTMVIGAVWAMQRYNFDFKHRSFFVAQDVDIRCVWMAYIQLSLYGIPAVVIHGNTLTQEKWSRWRTPMANVPLACRKHERMNKI